MYNLSKSFQADATRRLRRLFIEQRLKLGLSQSALARLLKRPQTLISKIESGERQVGLVEFIVLCRALRTSPVAVLRKVMAALDD